jgi:hypothetical protein
MVFAKVVKFWSRTKMSGRREGFLWRECPFGGYFSPYNVKTINIMMTGTKDIDILYKKYQEYR